MCKWLRSMREDVERLQRLHQAQETQDVQAIYGLLAASSDDSFDKKAYQAICLSLRRKEKTS